MNEDIGKHALVGESTLMRLVLSLLLVLGTIPVLSSEWFDGENLLVEPPDAGKYQAYEKSEPGWKSSMWQSKATGADDELVINIVAGRVSNLSRFRSSQDLPGQQACSDFESQLIDDAKRNGYKSLYWRTRCRVEDTTIVVLQLAIAGRNSLYHVRKLWRGPIPDGDLDNWAARLEAVSLCDTRRKNNPCPDGYEKVEGL